MAEIRRGYGTPPETIEYLDRKGWRPSFSWLDVSGDEHAHAYAIAKVTEAGLASTFKRSLLRAEAKGEGFETWRKKIVADLHATGWGVARHVPDPTGKTGGKMVDFTSRRRLETIFWGNMAAARAAGQWERAQRSKFALPYFLYLHTTSAHPRKDHLQWVGLIRPVDDPCWTHIFPPNGWRCKCAVSQISRAEAGELLARPTLDDPEAIHYTDAAPRIEMRTWTNTRTGEVMTIPKGCDPGWGGNPGLARVKGTMRAIEETLLAATPEDATALLEDLWQSPWTRVTARLPDALAKEVWMPAGVSPRLQAELGARSPIVSMSGLDIKKRSNLGGTAYADGRGYEDLARLPHAIAEGAFGPDPRGNKDTRSFLWRHIKTWYRGFIKKSISGYLRVTSLHQRIKPKSASVEERD